MECQNNFWPWFSEDEYKSRYARLRAAMAEKNLDCLVIYGSGGYLGTDPGQPNVAYIASFVSFVQTYVVFPLDEREEATVFVTWGNHLKNAQQVTRLRDVRVGGMAQTPDRVADRLKELGLENKRIGIVGAMAWANITLPHEQYLTITGALSGAEFEIVTEWFEGVRLVKSEEEMAYTRRGAAMTDAAYDVMVRSTRPGVRPCDLYNIVLRVAQDMDGKIPFGHVGRTPMSDPDMVYAHQTALTTPIQMGDVVMTEIAVGWGGYFGKIWGTYFMGDPTPEYEEMFRLSQKTHAALHAAIRPGVKGEALTRPCLDIIQSAGYKSRSAVFGWSNYNSPPDIRSAGDTITGGGFVFEKNHCLNILPWTVDRAETRGVWLGDTSAVTEDGIENLHKYPLTEITVVS
ncbi:MAG: M24 family metallopeptidase [bacterium]